MNGYMVANAIACAAAIWFAAHHSMEAKKAAFALFVGFLFYISAWLPDGYAPRDMIHAISGDKLKSPQLWMASDIIVMLYIAILAIRQWWGVVLILSFSVQIICHVMRIMDLFDFATYSNILDKIFIVQIAVFIALGWPNARDRVIDFIGRKWHSHRVHKKGEILPKGRGE